MGYARLIVNILFTNSTKICMRGCSRRKLHHYAKAFVPATPHCIVNTCFYRCMRSYFSRKLRHTSCMQPIAKSVAWCYARNHIW